MNKFYRIQTVGLLWLIVASLSICRTVPVALGEEVDESERASRLEQTFVKLYLYPINRLLDFQDIIQFGIAGSLGLGAEVAFTEKASFGAYYTAREAGIAFHGHQKKLSWLDAPTWADPTVLTAPIKLIPGVDNKQRTHKVERGYATASFAGMRYESEENEKLHFKRFGQKAVLHQFLPTEEEADSDTREIIDKIDESLHKDNEEAIRLEVVAGLVHPYVALELHELRDFAGGLFFLDLKEDDWETEPGRNKLRKLGRGISNIVTGILEVPMNIYEIDEIDGGFAAITYGTTRGFWRFLIRSAFVGPWEVVTFPVNTDSILEPEFPFLSTTSEVSWRIKYK